MARHTNTTRKPTIDTQKRVVCLISGGIDSPVASWMAIRKGCTPVFVYCDNSPFADQTTRQRALDTVRKLSEHEKIRPVKFYSVPHGGDLAEILRNCPRNLTCVLCRRMMYRIAEKIAEIEHADAIITGEIIGEHASQTLRNLHVENMALSHVALLRPLSGLNKTEVEQLARKIGTFTASTKPASCCSGPPPMPRTRAKIEEIQEAEAKLEIENMLERDLKSATVLTI